jgi:hypothetical protein
MKRERHKEINSLRRTLFSCAKNADPRCPSARGIGSLLFVLLFPLSNDIDHKRCAFMEICWVYWLYDSWRDVIVQKKALVYVVVVS